MSEPIRSLVLEDSTENYFLQDRVLQLQVLLAPSYLYTDKPQPVTSHQIHTNLKNVSPAGEILENPLILEKEKNHIHVYNNKNTNEIKM